MSIQITYYGHSCFIISCQNYSIALDPYRPLPGYPPLQIEANEVLCSHDHTDHAYTKAVKIIHSGKDPFRVRDYEIPHDDKGGSLRGMNLIRVFEAEGMRVAHFGDIGCALPKEYIKLLSGLDAALVPVGGYYTIDAAQANALREQIRPRVFIPMHYRDGERGFPEIGTLDDFLSLAGPCTRLDTNTIELTKDAPEGVIVPRFQQ